MVIDFDQQRVYSPDGVRQLGPDARERIRRGVEHLRGVFPDHDGVTCVCGRGSPCECNREQMTPGVGIMLIGLGAISGVIVVAIAAAIVLALRS